MFCKRAFPTLRDKGALSLLTLQLQGCETMSTDVMDIPYVFTAAWVGLLGADLLWMSQCSKINRGTRVHVMTQILVLQKDLTTLTQQASFPNATTNVLKRTTNVELFWQIS